jgi:hypothetical protein
MGFLIVGDINMLRVAFVFLLLIGSVSSGFAHPGRTASDGCHYCRTNCDSWGEVKGARHCHGNNVEELSPKFTPIKYEPDEKVTKPKKEDVR